MQTRLAFTGSSVIKQGPPDGIAVEAAKTGRAYELARRTGLFRVPRVLAHDPETGRLELERVYGFEAIQWGIAYWSSVHPLWARIGRVLGTVHGQLSVPNGPRLTLPPEWTRVGEEEVEIHGDFNAVNVQYSRAADTVLVLDWSLTPLMGGPAATVGSRYFDVAWFLISLFFMPCRMLLRRPVRAKADRFLAAYSEASGCELDWVRLTEAAFQAAELWVAKLARTRVKRVIYRHFMSRLRRYMTYGSRYCDDL